MWIILPAPSEILIGRHAGHASGMEGVSASAKHHQFSPSETALTSDVSLWQVNTLSLSQGRLLAASQKRLRWKRTGSHGPQILRPKTLKSIVIKNTSLLKYTQKIYLTNVFLFKKKRNKNSGLCVVHVKSWHRLYLWQSLIPVFSLMLGKVNYYLGNNNKI